MTVTTAPEPLTVVVRDHLRVMGQVLAANGRPAAGATVEASMAGEALGLGPPETVTTGPDGGFELRRLSAERLRLSAHRDLDFGDLDVELDETGSAPLKLAMVTGGRLAGVVRSESGQPLAGIDVYAFTHPSQLAPQHVHTDRDGRYAVGPLRPGQISVAALLPGNHRYYSSAPRPEQRDLDLGAGEERSDVDFRLPEQNQSLDGRVLDPAGQPLEGIVVYLALDSGRFSAFADRRALSDDDGRFRFDKLGGGLYRLRAEHPDYPAALVGGARPGAAAIALRFSAALALDGQLQDERGRPVADATLILTGKDERKNEQAQMEVHDPRGRFHVSRTAAGRYDLYASSAGGLVGSALDVEIGSGHLEAVRLVLRPPVTVSGRLIRQPTGKPVPGWTVQENRQGRTFTARTDADGRFALAGLDGGASVAITFRPPDAGKIYLLRVDPAPGQSQRELGDVEINAADGSLLHLAAPRAP